MQIKHHPCSRPAWWNRWVTLAALLVALAPLLARAQDKKKQEGEDRFEKWQKQDVRYIITPEEKEVFAKLTVPEEKERFIEQFWLRRDPDPATPSNEFKEEHYRRIAYANEQFAEGTPGWLTDRGRIYIIHGPPDRVESHVAGEVAYERRPEEGGGTTATFPFIRWWYRHIEGVGNDIELEFVDKRFTGAYKLTTDTFEKDALMHTNFGQTLAEMAGAVERVERYRYTPQRGPDLRAYREQDSPFEKYRTLVKMEAPQPIKYRDLEREVKVNITYAVIPVRVRLDYFRLDENRALVPVTVEIPNKDLQFREQGTVYAARMAVYGKVTSLTNRVVAEFDQDIMASYQPRAFERGKTEVSLYQKILTLDAKMRYKLELVVKDQESGKMGFVQQGIVTPGYGLEQLTASSLILTNSVRTLDSIPEADQMFVLGDVRIHPKMDTAFSRTGRLGVYLQVYNAARDPQRSVPSLRVRYRVLRDGKPVKEVVDDSGQSIQYFSPQRVVLIQIFSLQDLEPGRYSFEVKVEDRIAGQTATAREQFRVIDASQAALAPR